MVIITIHRGEILQIKRLVTSNKKLKGSLYGLYTESNQPVVLIVCGEDKTKIAKYLWENHKLLKLGEWIVTPKSGKDRNKVSKSSKGPVTLIFDEEGEYMSAHFEGTDEAETDILQYQSAFREYGSLRKYLQDKTKLDNSPIEIIEIKDTEKENKPLKLQPESHIMDVRPHDHDVSCDSRTPQWYNSDRDTFQNIYNFVRSTFADGGTVEISRNTSTKDMTFKLNHSQFSWAIAFPAGFPKGVVILRNNRGSEKRVSSQEQTPNVANMKNELRETFFNMCKCRECSGREAESWV